MYFTSLNPHNRLLRATVYYIYFTEEENRNKIKLTKQANLSSLVSERDGIQNQTPELEISMTILMLRLPIMVCQAWSEGQTTMPSSAGVSSCITEVAFIFGQQKIQPKMA